MLIINASYDIIIYLYSWKTSISINILFGSLVKHVIVLPVYLLKFSPLFNSVLNVCLLYISYVHMTYGMITRYISLHSMSYYIIDNLNKVIHCTWNVWHMHCYQLLLSVFDRDCEEIASVHIKLSVLMYVYVLFVYTVTILLNLCTNLNNLYKVNCDYNTIIANIVICK